MQKNVISVNFVVLRSADGRDVRGIAKDNEIWLPGCYICRLHCGKIEDHYVTAVWYDAYCDKVFVDNVSLEEYGEESDDRSNIIACLAPGGYAVYWIVGVDKTNLIVRENLPGAEVVELSGNIQPDWQEEINRFRADFKSQRFVRDECELTIRCMKRSLAGFCYRYQLNGADGSDAVIKEVLIDGTHDKINDGRLIKYHVAGKPKKFVVEWQSEKSEYSTYFWFDDEKISSFFEKFYGMHRDTKTDFMITIDAENKQYGLALYRQGLKEPVAIPESAYQLIVFKNKFEDYRSENYNQPRGAWIW